MHPLIYDVAVSIDGFIAGPDSDISKFAHDGKVVDDYRQRLAGYSAAIMGRRTYTFGYDFGLKPGENPYPHMRSIVVSRGLGLPEHADVSLWRATTPERIKALKAQSDGPVYLVGGGDFAAQLMAAGLIDRIILKRAPILLGSGVPLFAQKPIRQVLRHVSLKDYGDGTLLQQFEVETAHAA